MWTRNPSQIKWSATREAAIADMALAQEKCREQAWVKKSAWVVHGESEATAKLEALRLGV